jgi:hypothetical protein
LYFQEVYFSLVLPEKNTPTTIFTNEKTWLIQKYCRCLKALNLRLPGIVIASFIASRLSLCESMFPQRDKRLQMFFRLLLPINFSREAFMKSANKLFGLALLALALPLAQANATALTDPTGDFIAAFGGVKGADLDVVYTDVVYDGSNFNFYAEMNGAIGTTPGFYVWGIDRGTGATTSNFASLGLPGIFFDALLFVNPDGSGRVSTLGAGATTTQFVAGSFSIVGNSFSAVISESLLPTKGFSFDQYTQNLWPRFNGVVPAGTTNISDFAADATMTKVSVPEPASLSLFGLGLLALGFNRKKQRA